VSPWQERLLSRYERLAAPSSDQPLPLSVEMWAQERLHTALHFVENKIGKERDGWIEDARYWRLIVERLGMGEGA
jgi:transposase